jgi:hypothetical protein
MNVGDQEKVSVHIFVYSDPCNFSRSVGEVAYFGHSFFSQFELERELPPQLKAILKSSMGNVLSKYLR